MSIKWSENDPMRTFWLSGFVVLLRKFEQMFLVRNIFLAIVATTVIPLDSNGQAAESILQSDLEVILIEEGLTGVAWSTIGENGEVRVGAAGLRDNLSQSNFTIDTRFHVGSLTKSFLATGVLRLVTEGMIELDAPACTPSAPMGQI